VSDHPRPPAAAVAVVAHGRSRGGRQAIARVHASLSKTSRIVPQPPARCGYSGSDSRDRRRSVRRHHASVRAREVDRLVAVLPADPVVLPLALPHHLDHLTVPAERVERGGVDGDLIALLGVHPASSGRRLQTPAQRARSPGPIRRCLLRGPVSDEVLLCDHVGCSDERGAHPARRHPV